MKRVDTQVDPYNDGRAQPWVGANLCVCPPGAAWPSGVSRVRRGQATGKERRLFPCDVSPGCLTPTIGALLRLS
ncbi:MAG: hypothetical protein KJ046_17375 [Anaerolineae bacterium]|nr:hypothetical protein [Anaerolineae bacterium]